MNTSRADGARPYRMGARREAVEATRDAICGATVELWLEVAYDDMTLDDIAARAGVTRQTVLRHYGSKENLVLAAAEWYAPKLDAMHQVEPGDVAGAVVAIIGRYETMGDANIRMLDVEGRIEPIHRALESGRREHRKWVADTFAPAMDHLPRRAREAAIDALYAATDVTLWKLLRRDLGRSVRATEAVIARLVTGVIETLPPAGEGAQP